MDNKNYGIITEQGFIVGNGLGFQPVKESELKPQDPQESEVAQQPPKTQKPQTK